MAKINRRSNVGAANAAATNKEEVAMKKEATVTENAPETKEQQNAPEKDAEEKVPETPAEENQENLPAAVSEKKPGFFSKEAREERAAVKAAKRAEKLAKNEALRKEGHVVKAAVGDLAIAAGEGAAKALKIAGGVVVIGGVVAGGLALANAKANKEESGEDPEEPDVIGEDNSYAEKKEEEETTETDKVEVVEF